MRTPRHHPVIMRTEDLRWVLMCRDCHEDNRSAIPLGIDLPVGSLRAAELIRATTICARRLGATYRSLARRNPRSPVGPSIGL